MISIDSGSLPEHDVSQCLEAKTDVSHDKTTKHGHCMSLHDAFKMVFLLDFVF